MSKSMWCDAVEAKPVSGPVLPNISVDVCFWRERSYRPYWGHFDSQLNGWITSDQKGVTTIIEAAQVQYFAYLDNPYK